MTTMESFKAALRQLTRAEMREATKEFKVHVARLDAAVALSFYPGDLVQFTSKRGQVVEGHVTKVNARSIKVAPISGGSVWKVPPSLLRKVEAGATPAAA